MVLSSYRTPHLGTGNASETVGQECRKNFAALHIDATESRYVGGIQITYVLDMYMQSILVTRDIAVTIDRIAVALCKARLLLAL